MVCISYRIWRQNRTKFNSSSLASNSQSVQNRTWTYLWSCKKEAASCFQKVNKPRVESLKCLGSLDFSWKQRGYDWPSSCLGLFLRGQRSFRGVSWDKQLIRSLLNDMIWLLKCIFISIAYKNALINVNKQIVNNQL